MCNSAMIIRLIYNKNCIYIFTWKRTYPVCNSAMMAPSDQRSILVS